MPSEMPPVPNPLYMLSFGWLESWRCAAELGKRNVEEMRRLRNRYFQEMSYCLESYMRSPAFLQMIRANMMMMRQVRPHLGALDPVASVSADGEKGSDRAGARL